MECPRCGAEMEGGVCPNCGFPVIRTRPEVRRKHQWAALPLRIGKRRT